MTDPFKIEFEDDIVLVLKAFIKKTKQVSPTLWTLFPLLGKVFEKNKQTFGNLLDTINSYLLSGNQYLAANKQLLQLVIEWANMSLFSKEPNITIQNSEGAILFQLLFQVYKGTTVLDEYFELILEKILERMQALPMADHLKRHLLGVFLSATSYNPTVAITYMEKKGITGEVIS